MFLNTSDFHYSHMHYTSGFLVLKPMGAQLYSLVLVGTLKSCDRGVRPLDLNVSFLLLAITFTLQKSWKWNL